MTSARKDYWICVTLFLLGINCFIWGLGDPPYLYFDEYRYVAAAQQFMEHGVNENWAHPPLGKILIGLGLQLFGYTPWGWRIMSAGFGALTLVAMYLLGLGLFRTRMKAIQVAFLTMFNQLLFINSRIAMLDVFMMAFVCLAWASFVWYWTSLTDQSGPRKKFLYASGVFFGLALGVKWFAVVPLAVCIGLLIPVRRRVGVGQLKVMGVSFLLAPLIIYFCIFLPCLNMVHPRYAATLQTSHPTSLSSSQKAGLSQEVPEKKYVLLDFFRLQLRMFEAQKDFNSDNHPDQSKFYEWPLMQRLMWYDYRTGISEDGRWGQGVLLIGNPLVMWGGVLAIFICIWSFFKHRSKDALFIISCYFGCLLCWIFIPRKIEFSYYYYPSALVLSLAIVCAASFLRIPRWINILYSICVFSLFCFFYPVISQQKLNEREFSQRMWLKGWKNPLPREFSRFL